MQFKPFVPAALAALAAMTLVALTGCGANSSAGGANASATTRISGSAIAGAVDGTVVISDADGDSIASAAVNNGGFSVSLPNAALDAMLSFTVTGSYVDEVSGDTVTLSSAAPLALTLAAGHFNAGQAGHAPVTPDSTVIHHLVRTHAMSLTQARNAFQNAFGYLPDLEAVPFDPSATDSASAAARPQADRDAAFRAGVFSQLASDLGLSQDDIAALLTALAADLSDGDLDGNDGVGAVNIGAAGVDLQALHQGNPLAARLLAAYGGFAGHGNNTAAVTAPSSGLPSMAYDAPGASKTITSASGRLLTVTLDAPANDPIGAGFWTARVKHQITLTDAATQQPIDLASDPNFKGVSHHPYMHMLSGHDHSTPHGHAAVAVGGGVYNLDAYYVMASQMGMGAAAAPMGVWDYPVNISEDVDADGTADVTTTVMFHPQVRMPMDGSLFFAGVNNANHRWTTMMGMTQPRPYRVWLHQISANNGGGHDLTVFVSTRDIGNMDMGGGHSMMRFPAAYSGQTLHGPLANGSRPDVTLASVGVEVFDLGSQQWRPMTESANSGLFSITAVSGLSGVSADTLSFRLTINDGSGDHVMTTATGGNAELSFIAP
ncbi:hypothetical protein Tel_15840 [Candidatus Tenderia electrophaga]|jgi:hypothetical protein|uniref:Uncharacterized protein n=1 Tax=Candidatus Tenderia electrophaga TaxID=1748243 RepID=A0A0S2TH64_9GAMM|nr:hypothetical protein Tel_15840 [Candidatus Tenderia electrophaga]